MLPVACYSAFKIARSCKKLEILFLSLGLKFEGESVAYGAEGRKEACSGCSGL